MTQSHSYKTDGVGGSFNNCCFSSSCPFLLSLTFYELANKWSLFWSTFLPRCSSSSTLFKFPLLFFGKFFNQFTLPWGQIPAQIKHFNLLWKWEAANTFPYDVIDFSNMTLFFHSPHTRLNWTIKIHSGGWKTLQQQWLSTRKPTMECWHWSAHIDHQMSSSSWSLHKNNKVRGKTHNFEKKVFTQDF